MKKCWKQVLMFVLVTVATICIGRTETKAATIVEKGSCGDKATYTLDSKGTLTISGSGEMDSSFLSYFSYDLLYEYPTIKNVIIEDGITDICSFQYCSSLESITIPQSVSSIEQSTFLGCRNLTDIKLPNSILEIGIYAFQECSSLKKMEIPNGVTKIGGGAFYGCEKLSYVKIPKSVKQIDYDSFEGCVSLEKIEVAADNPVYNSGNNGNAIIETANKKLVLVGCKATEVPSGVTQIEYGAFSNCKELTQIYIPKNVEDISRGAFYGCNNLTSITVDGKNSKYDSRKNCNAVIETSTNSLIAGCQSTVIPDGITSIGYDAFAGQTSLTSIDIPDSITMLGSGAFEKCTGLKKVRLSKNITEIQSDTFYQCEGLEEIDIPDSVTTIESRAFSCCTSLKKVKLSKKISSIEENAFEFCKKLESIELPNTLTVIDARVFEGCGNLKKINLPSNLKSIGEWAFWDCTNLADVELPECLTEIRRGAFFGTKLQKITIPESVTSIEEFSLGYKDNYEMNKVAKYVIYGTKGSAAETYAKENGFTFKTTGSTTELTSKNTTVKLSKTSFNFDGKAQKPTVKVLDTKGRTLKKSYYTVTYSNNVKVGKATATITFKGKYSGTIKKTFTIKPAKTTITGTSRKSDSVTLTWKKQKKEASGYQIQYATDRKFTKNAKTVVSKGTKKSSKKIRGLSKKTTYYFRVRTYKAVNGKKYYSGWSKIETVKTK